MIPPSRYRNDSSDSLPPTATPAARPTTAGGRSLSRYCHSAFLRYHATAKMSPTHSMGRRRPVDALPPNEMAMSGTNISVKPVIPALDMPITMALMTARTHW